MLSITTGITGWPPSGPRAGSACASIASTVSSPPVTLPEDRVVGRQAGVGRGDHEELAARRCRAARRAVFAIATVPRVYAASTGGFSVTE